MSNTFEKESKGDNRGYINDLCYPNLCLRVSKYIT